MEERLHAVHLLRTSALFFIEIKIQILFIAVGQQEYLRTKFEHFTLGQGYGIVLAIAVARKHTLASYRNFFYTYTLHWKSNNSPYAR